MWGHLFQLLRDIAVNESDQERVSDSGAIRSGLVPQLKHNAIHRRAPSPGGPSEEDIRLWARHCNRRSRVNAPATGRKVRRCDSKRARSVVPWAGRCTRENVTPCPHWSPTRYPLDLRNDWSSVTLHRLRCGLLLRWPPRGPPLSVHRRSIAWSFGHDVMQSDHACGRGRADDNRRSLRELWLRNGRLPDLVEAGILCRRDARAAQGAA
jgi:hypothetical protein